MVQVPNSVVVDALFRWYTSLTVAAPLKLHLFQNAIIPGPGSVLADFVEATFDGYAAVDDSDMVFMNDSLLGPVMKLDQILYNMTGTLTPNTVYGYYLTDSTGAVLIAADVFPTPALMTGLTSFILLQPVIPMQIQSTENVEIGV